MELRFSAEWLTSLYFPGIEFCDLDGELKFLPKFLLEIRSSFSAFLMISIKRSKDLTILLATPLMKKNPRTATRT